MTRFNVNYISYCYINTRDVTSGDIMVIKGVLSHECTRT